MLSYVYLTICGEVDTALFPTLDEAVEFVSANGDLTNIEMVPVNPFRHVGKGKPAIPGSESKFTAAIMDLHDQGGPLDAPLQPEVSVGNAGSGASLVRPPRDEGIAVATEGARVVESSMDAPRNVTITELRNAASKLITADQANKARISALLGNYTSANGAKVASLSELSHTDYVYVFDGLHTLAGAAA